MRMNTDGHVDISNPTGMQVSWKCVIMLILVTMHVAAINNYARS